MRILTDEHILCYITNLVAKYSVKSTMQTFFEDIFGRVASTVLSGIGFVVQFGEPSMPTRNAHSSAAGVELRSVDPRLNHPHFEV